MGGKDRLTTKQTGNEMTPDIDRMIKISSVILKFYEGRDHSIRARAKLSMAISPILYGFESDDFRRVGVQMLSEMAGSTIESINELTQNVEEK